MKRWDSFCLIAQWLRPSDWQQPPRVEAGKVDWRAIVSAAGHHGVAASLAWRLRDHPAVPPDVAEFFEAVLTLNRQRNSMMLDGLALALEALDREGIRPVLLKGAGHLVGGLYLDQGMRMVDDLDLLFREEELEAAPHLLRRVGFVPGRPPNHPTVHQSGMLVHERLGVGIEPHRFPASQALQDVIDTRGIFSRACAVAFRGHTVLLPAPLDRMAIIIAQEQIRDVKSNQGIPQLRRFLDLALLARTHSIDWGELEERFAHRGYGSIVRRTFVQTDFLLGSGAGHGDPSVRRMARVINRRLHIRVTAAIFAVLARVPGYLWRHHPRDYLQLFNGTLRQKLLRDYRTW